MNMPTDDAGAAATEKGALFAPDACGRGVACSTTDCSILNVLVRNISATGAKLTGSELICLPDEFELQVNDGNGVFVSRRVRRIWSHADAVGVAFVDLGARTISGFWADRASKRGFRARSRSRRGLA